MTITYGMTIAQFKEIVEDMRKCYPFTDDGAQLGNLLDPLGNSASVRQVELHTTDEETGVFITMRKAIPNEKKGAFNL